MKILHALVGYLAVISLPFHPFAFASPLELIDYYDGYVNTTQNNIDGALMEHFLGTILETCQTVTMPDHGNSTLVKRGDIIEARQAYGAAGYAPYVIAIIAVVAAVTVLVFYIESDDPKREAFTQNTISGVIAKWPQYNWVICHSPYSTAFDGVEGTDYGYTHHELKISFGRTIGYDLYWAKSGTFYLNGDGGFINWAYNGNILGIDNGGTTVHFGVPS